MSKIFLKNFWAYCNEVIMLNFYITETSLFLEYLQRYSQVTKAAIERCSIKINSR